MGYDWDSDCGCRSKIKLCKKLMRRTIFYLPLFLLFLLLLSCSPSPVLRLSPLANETSWLDGKEFATISADSIEAAVAFESMDAKLIVFEVEITNRSEQPVLVSPEKFYSLPLFSPQDTMSFPTSAQAGFAIDPESKILDIDKQISREKASYSTMEGVDLIFGLLGVVAAIATIGQEKTEEEIKQEQQQRRELEILDREQEINHKNNLAKLQNEKVQWTSSALRRTTLNPNHTTIGKVYFPANYKARYIKLCLPIGKTRLQIVFAQRKHKA